MKKMNIANRITLIRLFMVPVFVIVFNIYGTDSLIPAIVFSITAFTDSLDGHLARTMNLVTNFGKFMDPLVDKILTLAGFVVLVGAGSIPAWTVIVIIFRELLIDGLRMLAASENVTIAASIYGKIKTISQMVTIIMYLAKDILVFLPEIVFTLALYISVALTIISGLDYLIKNIKILNLGDM